MSFNITRTPLIFALSGALVLGSGKAFAQDRTSTGGGQQDIYTGVTSAQMMPPQVQSGGHLSGLGLPRVAEGLALQGKFEVPFYAKLVTNGKFAGHVRYLASDGTRLLLVARVRAKVAGKDQNRDVVATLRPDSSGPTRLKFVGRMVENVDDAVLAKVKGAATLDAKINALLVGVVQTDDSGGPPKSPESMLELASGSGGKELKLHRIKDNGSRGELITFKRADGSGAPKLEVNVKGYSLQLDLPS